MKTKKCKFYEKQLYLYREGELKEKERDRLNKHVSSCPECAALAKKLKNLEMGIQQVGDERPVPDNPVALTNDIMRAVTSFEKFSTYQKHDKYNNIFELLFAPRLRFALFAVIVFVVSLFFIQEALLMGRIAKLEQKISRNTDTVIYSADKKIYTALESKLSLLEKAGTLPKNNFSAVKNNNIIIDETSFSALLENYKSIKIQNEILLKLLKNKYPDIYHINAKRGLDQAEIEKLLLEKDDILRFIKEL